MKLRPSRQYRFSFILFLAIFFLTSTIVGTASPGRFNRSFNESILSSALASGRVSPVSRFWSYGQLLAGGFTVNSTGDASDINPGDGKCEVDEMQTCTLRAAIQEANTTPTEPSGISFDLDPFANNCIMMTGVCTIQLTSSLPTILAPLTINGYTQHSCGPHQPPCSRANTSTVGNNAVLLIQLNGSGLGAFAGGLSFAGGSGIAPSMVSVQGLIINGFSQFGITFSGNFDAVVEGCFIGTDPTGTTALGNGLRGISISNGGPTRIGGSAPSQRNIISGNDVGIFIGRSGAATIQGNYIGTNAAGTADLGNTVGVSINSSAGVTISAATVGGGTSTPGRGAGNVISGNVWGVMVAANDNGFVGPTTIRGNIIGLAADGMTVLGNDRNGIELRDSNLDGDGGGAIAPVTIGGNDSLYRNVIAGNGSPDPNVLGNGIVNAANGTVIQGNFIGTDMTGTISRGNEGFGIAVEYGYATIRENIVANNGFTGISVLPRPFLPPTTGVLILSNSIFSNAQKGIELLGNANGNQSFPILNSADSSGGNTTIQGTFNGIGSTTLEFFASPVCDNTGFGEGQTFLGSTVVNGGISNFSVTLPVTVPIGQVVTSTATSPPSGAPNGNTSEFSACRTVTGAPPTPTPTPTITPTPTPTPTLPQDKIVFTSERNGDNGEIYVMNTDGSNQITLTNDAESFITNNQPSISLNGSRIAFSSDREPLFGSNFEIFVLNPDGSNLTRVTNYADFDFSPSLNGDGSRIAFTSYRELGYQIYVMNADGSSVIRLTSEGRNLFPSFSPDGSRIVFTTDFQDGNREIFVMNSDGTNLIRLTDNPALDEFPSFSPDGSRITFASNRDGNSEIYVMNADGSNQTRVTSDAAWDENPSFSPDGSQIVFDSDRNDGNFEIYVMNTDGSNITRLTFSPDDDYDPSWSGQATNTAPVLSNVAVTSPINENAVATLSGNISNTNAGDTFSLTVSWGDGSAPQVFNYAAGTVSFNETHQYLDDNPTATSSDSYPINLSLNDSAGGNDTDSAIVTVNNLAPVLSDILATPSTINAGASTILTGNISDNGALDSHTVVINWGDGSPATTLNLAAGVSAFSTAHQYNLSGNFNIGIIASDDDSGSANGGAIVTVNPVNSPPFLSNVAVSSPINENGAATLSGNIADADAGNAFVLTVNWGDGTPAQVFTYAAGTTAFSEAHQYPDDNPTATALDNYTINLTLADGSGGSDIDSVVVTVNNLAPALSDILVSPATITTGDSTTLSGNISDPGTQDQHTVVINWGDGSPATILNLAAGISAFNANHQYNSSGNFNIGITATDDDTGSVAGGTIVTVNTVPNSPPVLSNVVVTSPINENGIATLTGNISDPNAADTLSLMVNWGDGSAPQFFNFSANSASFSPTHRYRDDNPTATPFDNYTINLTVSDSNGGGTAGIAVVRVNNLAPVLSNILVSPATVTAGSSPTLSGIVTDVGTLDTHTVVINWGDGSANTTVNLAVGASAFNAAHQYGFAGVFNIVVAAVDDDTGSANGGASVTVNPPVAQEKIVFSSERDGNREIYIMNADGTNQIRLTNNPANDAEPSLSPDGNLVAFVSRRDGNSEIYVMNSDGTNQTRLTNNPGVDNSPSFSPFGNRITFGSTRDGSGEIYVMDSDGTNQVRVTNNPAGGGTPSFSPDGSKIVFVSFCDANAQCIYVMNSDGTNRIRLTKGQFSETQPTFSPDGNQIAFVSWRGGNNYEIRVMNSDGTNQTRLTSGIYTFKPSYSSDGSKIAFSSQRNGTYDLYAMNRDGTNLTRLTNNQALDGEPSFRCAPFRATAQKRIAFFSERDGNREIYVMNPDGTNQVRLTNNPALDDYPSFSPDGSKITFVSNRDGNFEIYVMNSDGTNQTRLTSNVSADFFPSFSPDGSWIAFTSDRDGNSEIYVMNSDGTNQIRVTDNPAVDDFPSFSPDGSRLVFVSNRDGDFEIYVMNSNGANQTRLTNNPAGDFFPSFSPDSSRIAFTSKRDGNDEIYVMNANGTNLIRLTTNPASDSKPSFSPDGSKIAFVSTRNSNYEIYVMNSDGKNQSRLTNNSAYDFAPAWGK
jgi:CSLREA domain-containing protein